MMNTTFYEILGVAENATFREIKRAYRRLTREFHPYFNKSENAADTFTLVTIAYNNLIDSRKRVSYDFLLRLRRGEDYTENVREKFENDVERNSLLGKSRAEKYLRMSYGQYRRDEFFLASSMGILMQGLFATFTGIILAVGGYLLLQYMYGENEKNWNPNAVLISTFVFVPILAGITVLYEPVIKYLIVGKPKFQDPVPNDNKTITKWD